MIYIYKSYILLLQNACLKSMICHFNIFPFLFFLYFHSRLKKQVNVLKKGLGHGIHQ